MTPDEIKQAFQSKDVNLTSFHYPSSEAWQVIAAELATSKASQVVLPYDMPNASVEALTSVAVALSTSRAGEVIIFGGDFSLAPEKAVSFAEALKERSVAKLAFWHNNIGSDETVGLAFAKALGKMKNPSVAMNYNGLGAHASVARAFGEALLATGVKRLEFVANQLGRHEAGAEALGAGLAGTKADEVNLSQNQLLVQAAPEDVEEPYDLLVFPQAVMGVLVHPLASPALQRGYAERRELHRAEQTLTGLGRSVAAGLLAAVGEGERASRRAVTAGEGVESFAQAFGSVVAAKGIFTGRELARLRTVSLEAAGLRGRS